MRFGKPLSFERFYDRPADRFVLRSVTDELMYEIMLLSGQEYVDEYASKLKAPSAEPGAIAGTPGGEGASSEAPAAPTTSSR